MDRLLETMLAVWSAEPSIAGEPSSRIGDGTWSQPHPPLFVGGGVRASARRAVWFKLGLSLPAHLPELAQYYRELCEQASMEPLWSCPPGLTEE